MLGQSFPSGNNFILGGHSTMSGDTFNFSSLRMREVEATVIKSVAPAAGKCATMQATAPYDKELFGSKSH